MNSWKKKVWGRKEERGEGRRVNKEDFHLTTVLERFFFFFFLFFFFLFYFGD